MNAPSEPGVWVPKVHPLTRPIAEDDPLELVAQPALGDPQQMLACLLEEFLAMGWEAEALAGLFQNPGYPLLVELGRSLGQHEVERQITALVARGAQLRVTEQIVEEPGCGCSADGLLQILPAPSAAGQDAHDGRFA